MAEYVLIASRFDHVVERYPSGQPKTVVKYRRGDRVVDLSEADENRLRRAGAIAPWVDEPPADAVEVLAVDAEPQDDSVAEPVGEVAEAEAVPRPKATATKKLWVEYAVARGWDRDAAVDLDRQELIEALS